jgi:hypothetical protein
MAGIIALDAAGARPRSPQTLEGHQGPGRRLGDHSPMSTVIPIVDEAACQVRQAMLVMEPRFEGPAERVDALVKALVPLVGAELGPEWPTGAWLRALTLNDDEAVLTIAPGLACHGHIVATLAFDLMRRQLPDTDIYVAAAPA